MTTSDWMMLVAVLTAPIVAIQVQERLNKLREKRVRKAWIFQTLMATRAARISPLHVQALNSIDIEFSLKNSREWQRSHQHQRAVLDAWKLYHDHLYTSPTQKTAWGEKSEDLFIDLLYQMSKSLGYGFDKVHLRRGIYTPVAHGELERDQQVIRESLVRIVSGQQPIPITVAPPASAEQVNGDPQRLLSAILEICEGKRSVRIELQSEQSKALAHK